LLDSGIGELELGLERKCTTIDSVFETSRVDELGVRIDAWWLRWVVSGKERCRGGGQSYQTEGCIERHDDKLYLTCAGVVKDRRKMQ
jgi:hypothetical protein